MKPVSSIREAQQIFDAIFQAENNGHQSCLLMITQVKGSAYRRPGAKMMMADDGRMVGTLSGGCLEGDLYHWAEGAMKTQIPEIHHYDLVEDDMWGLGIGCKGEIDVLVEPITSHRAFWKGFAAALQDESPIVLSLDLPVGDRFYQIPGQNRVSLTSASQPRRAIPSLRPQGQTLCHERVLWDYLVPPAKFVVAGAGHDAKPVAELAHRAGFEVCILDRRPLFNNAREFPWASYWVLDERNFPPPHNWQGAFWVIMNHHQARDEAALQLAIKNHAQYIGVLGPLSRTEEMRKNLHLSGDADLPVYAPVGLDLGAERPEEVALSIVSELMMVRQQASGGHLTGRHVIHAG